MIDDLLLLSGNDLPFPEARLTIHQPRIKEIAYISEQGFWQSCQFLRFDKESLTSQDKVDLENLSNFNIIMKMIQERDFETQEIRVRVFSLLSLMFPRGQIAIDDIGIHITDYQTREVNSITQETFEQFKDILAKMFCLKENVKQYNPSGELAKKIADKIKRGKEKRAKLASKGSDKISIIGRYVSILAVGQKKDMNELMNYTIYQLMDEYTRFILKTQYDSWIQFKCAGAQDMKDPQDWFKDIHDPKENNNT